VAQPFDAGRALVSGDVVPVAKIPDCGYDQMQEKDENVSHPGMLSNVNWARIQRVSCNSPWTAICDTT
jgi:hypothetical protein